MNMKAICLHDKDEIAAFLRRDAARHVYGIGDLDDFFWPYTTWYAHKDGEQITQIVLIYAGTDLPVLLAIAEEPADSMRTLLRALMHLLPRRFYTHLSEGLESAFADDYAIEPHGMYHKMALVDRARLAAVDTSATIRLAGADLPELGAFYEASYPGNWFDPRMLETGHYYGLRQDGKLVSVAGVHVYSPRYRVAALGNITTHPAFRGRGLAQVVTGRLCQSLLESVDLIGLNVSADNAAAIACYERLGFEQVARYGEYMLELK